MIVKEIKKWMIDQDIRQADIAADLNIRRSVVSQVLSNKKASKRITRWLLDNGCPEEFLHTEKTAA